MNIVKSHTKTKFLTQDITKVTTLMDKHVICYNQDKYIRIRGVHGEFKRTDIRYPNHIRSQSINFILADILNFSATDLRNEKELLRIRVSLLFIREDLQNVMYRIQNIFDLTRQHFYST